MTSSRTAPRPTARTLVLAAATVAGGAALFLAVPSPATAGTAGSANTAGTAACGNHALAVSASAEQGATGHANFVLRFKNVSAAGCSLHGYPGLDAVSSSGHVLAHAQRTVSGFTGGSHHGVPTVVIAPGHYASADVEWMNFDPTTGGDCAFSHAVATTAPNTTRTVRLARAVSVCRLQVHPTVAGTTGNG